MKKLSLFIIIALAAAYGCKKKPVPTSVQFEGTTLYFTSNKVATDLPWAGTAPYSVTGATSLTDGEANTDTIVAKIGDGNYPAKLCKDLVQDGHDDWYLPSIQEFKAIASVQDDLPGDYTGTYWTSTEINYDQAEYWYIHYPSQYNLFKSYEYDCLCARKD